MRSQWNSKSTQFPPEIVLDGAGSGSNSLREVTHVPGDPPSGTQGFTKQPDFRVNRPGLVAGLAQKIGRLAAIAILPVMVGCAGLHQGARIDTFPTDAVVQRAEMESTFEASRLTEYPLFELYWSSSDRNDGTVYEGYDQLSTRGVETLLAYARAHNLDGDPSRFPDGISDGQRAVIRAIVSHPYYGQFVSQDAAVPLARAFGLPTNEVQIDRDNRLEMAAPPSVRIPDRVTTQPAGALHGPNLTTLGDMMLQEYRSRLDYFEDASASDEVKGARALGLLRDYAQEGLLSWPQQYNSEQGENALLDAFEQLRFAHVYGYSDFSGIGMGAAQAYVLGLDPFNVQLDFPDASSANTTTHLSMSGGFPREFAFVDKWLEAHGRPTGAERLEGNSVLNYVAGGQPGHYRSGTFDERRAITSSSGADWGRLFFPGDEAVADLSATAGFDVAIDAIDAYGTIITTMPGDRLLLKHKDTGETLRAERQLEMENGEPKSWSAKFFTASGTEVAASDVVGLVMTPAGTPRGDGRAAVSAYMGYWGYCNKNAAQSVNKARAQLPQLDRDVIRLPLPNGEVLEVPKASAQKLIDVDLEQIGGPIDYSGWRYDDVAQFIELSNGEKLQGRVVGFKIEPAADVERTREDYLLRRNSDERPFLGGIIYGEGTDLKSIAVEELESATLSADGQTVSLKRANGSTQQVPIAQLQTELAFDGVTAARDGTKTIQLGDDAPIRGSFRIKLEDGTERIVAANDLASIEAETKHDLRFHHSFAFRVRARGAFGAESNLERGVSNGARRIQRFEVTEGRGSERPEWAGDAELSGIFGPLRRAEGDRLIFVMGAYKSGDRWYTSMGGWYQVNDKGRVTNAGFVKGETDFDWGSVSNFDWMAASGWNAFMDPELRLKLFVNGVTDHSKLERLAEQGDLPPNWRDHLVPQD